VVSTFSTLEFRFDLTDSQRERILYSTELEGSGVGTVDVTLLDSHLITDDRLSMDEERHAIKEFHLFYCLLEKKLNIISQYVKQSTLDKIKK